MGEIKRSYLDISYFGYAARGLGQLSLSRKQFHQALEITIKDNLLRQFSDLLPGVALLLSDLGQNEFAVELYSLALKNPYVANSQWFEDVVGKHIEKAAESLPPEVVEAAKERGCARDIWETAEELLVELRDATLTA
jgi:hypothetical protein